MEQEIKETVTKNSFPVTDRCVTKKLTNMVIKRRFQQILVSGKTGENETTMSPMAKSRLREGHLRGLVELCKSSYSIF